MKKLFTICTLLFCNTMFAPGYGEQDLRNKEEEQCLKGSAAMLACYLCVITSCSSPNPRLHERHNHNRKEPDVRKMQ